MKLHNNILFYCLMLCIMQLNAQQNLVPNPGFELGNESWSVPRCDHYSRSGNSKDFDTDILYWKQAHYNPSQLLGIVPSSDWYGENCYTNVYPNLYTSSKRYCYFGVDEGIRVALVKDGIPYRLKGGQTYTFRIKLFAGSNGHKGIRVMFTTWGEHWNSKKKGNTKFNDAANVGDDNMVDKYGYNWVTYTKTFTVPQGMDNKLENLIILHNYGAGSTDAHMDDVELYEGDCSQDLRVEDKTYTYIQTAPYEHQNIYAGYDAGVPNTAGNVVVKSGADIGYKGVHTVQLLPGFITEPNSNFKAFIAPCNRLCFYPTAYAGANTIICAPSQTYQLGFSPLGPDNSTYVWTADPASAISYLSSATIHNPVFTSPSTGLGMIRYTQTATNSCGEVVRSDVYINYDAQPSASPNVSVSNINMNHPLQFDLNFNIHTETIKLEIMDLTNNVLKTYLLEKGDVFTTSPLRWSAPDYFSFCNKYNVRVSSKNFCYDNWSAPTTFLWDQPHEEGPNVISHPNIFTPNGDGVNDLFCSNVVGAIEYSITVFNRFGNAIHKVQNQPVYGETTICMWNGRCTEPAPACANSGIVSPGTYYYIISYKGCSWNTGLEGYVQVNGGNNIAAGTEESNARALATTEKRNIFPNPTTGEFTVSTTENMKSVEVMDALGRIVYTKMVSGVNAAILLENVDSGIYFVRTVLENGTSLMDKIYLLKAE